MHTKVKDVKEEQEDDSILTAPGTSEGQRQAMEMAEAAREKKYKNPSLGRQLFMGSFDPELVFPFPKQSAEDKKIGDELVAKVSDFLKENLDANEVDANRTIPESVIKGLADMKLFAMKIPKEFGGLELSQVNYNKVLLAVGSICGSTTTLLSAHQSIGVPQPLLMFGTDEQKKKYLPRFSQGAISAFALTEPDVGSDPAKMTTEAKLSEDGDHYVINGSKLWCTNGTLADIIVVMAQTAPIIVNGREKKQVTAFIVEMDSPGIEIVHRCDFMGLNAIGNGLLKFTDVKVPRENVLWGEGRGLALALATLNYGRLSLPAASTGCAKQCLYIARKWGKERVQWGGPVGQHEPGAEKISYIAATTLAMEAITWLTSHWADRKDIDIRIEAAMAKYFCTEAMWEIADRTMQLRGGRGYEKAWSLKARGESAFPVERIMRDCRINTILEGTSEIMRLFLAREAMDPHLKIVMDIMKSKGSNRLKAIMNSVGFYVPWYLKQWIYSSHSNSYKDIGKLKTHVAFVDNTAHKLARTLFHYMARYQQGLEKKQRILGRLMDIGTELFAMAATCSYAAMLFKEKPQDSSSVELAEFFCKLSKRRIDQSFKELGSNDDHSANKTTQTVLDGDLEWLEEGVINTFS